MHVLKAGVPNVGFEPFAPQEVLSSLLVVGCYTRGEVYVEIVSPSPLQAFVWFSSLLPNVWLSLS